MKYLGGTGDYTVPWHHLELHRFGSVVEPKINCKKTRHNCHQNEVIWLVGWFTEGEGWFNKKGRRINFELNPSISFSSKQVILFRGCAACLHYIFFFPFPHLKTPCFSHNKCCFEMKRQNISGHNKMFQHF